jgi:hypothetical protein
LSQFVRHLGSQLEVLVTQATARGKGKGKARNSARAQQEQEESSDSEHDHDSNEEGGNNDEGQDGKALDDEDYVSHAFYRQHIEDGFEKRAPPKLSLAKPFYYPIDDAVTRTLAASKYTSKLAEYTLSVSNAFFASTTHAAAQDALAAHLAGDADSTTTLLNQVVNNLAAIKDMQRDRMFFLDLTSDPSSTPTQRDFANNVLKNEFTPTVQNKGGSARTNKKYAAYESSFLRATQFASAKASATRHLASGSRGDTGFGSNSGGGGSSGGSFSGQTLPNPNSKTQQKKKTAAAKTPAASAAAPADRAAAGKQKKKVSWEGPQADEE